MFAKGNECSHGVGAGEQAYLMCLLMYAMRTWKLLSLFNYKSTERMGNMTICFPTTRLTAKLRVLFHK